MQSKNLQAHQADHQDETTLAIEGAHCASCVVKIENAIKQVPGVQNAEMNLADHTVSIHGNANADALINAVEATGYHAKNINAEQHNDALQEKERQDLAYYK